MCEILLLAGEDVASYVFELPMQSKIVVWTEAYFQGQDVETKMRQQIEEYVMQARDGHV